MNSSVKKQAPQQTAEQLQAEQLQAQQLHQQRLQHLLLLQRQREQQQQSPQQAQQKTTQPVQQQQPGKQQQPSQQSAQKPPQQPAQKPLPPTQQPRTLPARQQQQQKPSQRTAEQLLAEQEQGHLLHQQRQQQLLLLQRQRQQQQQQQPLHQPERKTPQQPTQQPLTPPAEHQQQQSPQQEAQHPQTPPAQRQPQRQYLRQHQAQPIGLQQGVAIARAFYETAVPQNAGTPPPLDQLSIHSRPASISSVTTHGPKPSATSCTHCKRGIEFFTPYSSCLFCKVDICATCIEASKHPSSHSPVLASFQDIPTLPSTARSAKSCQQCSNEFHCRIDCIDCQDYTICEACFDTQQGIRAVAHEHSNFRRICEPNRSIVLDKDGLRPSSLVESEDSMGVWNYCASCSRGIGVFESVVMCKVCFLNFNGARKVCEACRITACFAHRTVDAIITVQLYPTSDEQEFLNSPFRCSHCSSGFSSLKDVCSSDHDHIDFKILVTDAARESMIHQGYRLSPSKETRIIDLPTLSEEDVLCSRCLNTFHQGTCRFCLNCKTSVFCPHCFPQALQYHRCIEEGFVCPDDTTIAIMGVKQPFEAKRTAENLIWYKMQATGVWTFTPPSETTRQLVEAINILPNSPWYFSALEDETPCWRNRETDTMTLRHPGNDGFTGLPVGWEFYYTRSGKILFTHRETNTATFAYPDSPRIIESPTVSTPTSPRSGPPLVQHRSTDKSSISSQSTSTLVTTQSDDRSGGATRIRRPSQQSVNTFPTIDSKRTEATWKGVKNAGKSRTAWSIFGTGVSLSISMAGMAMGQDLSGVGRVAGAAVKGIGSVVVTQQQQQQQKERLAAAGMVRSGGGTIVVIDEEVQNDTGAGAVDTPSAMSPDQVLVDPTFMPPPMDMSETFSWQVQDAAVDPINGDAEFDYDLDFEC